MPRGWIAALAFAVSTAGIAQTAPSTLAERTNANRYTLAFNDGQLSGPGAELLAREIADTQLFMVGEQHATATIAEIETALHRTAVEAGYGYAALEIGPVTAIEVERLSREGPGRLGAWLREPGHDFAVAFLFWEEELALVEQAVSASPARANAIWGLDQEFVGSLPLLLPRLDALARTPAQRDALAQLRVRSAADPMLLGSMPVADLEPLRIAFPETDNSEAAALIENLVLSNRIYAPFTGRGGSGYDGNLARETYMKRNFLRAFAAAEAADGRPPRVFLKFGANHMMRGFSTTDVPALGNFVAEWSLVRGFSTTNIFIGCVGGQQNDPRSRENTSCDSSELPDDSPLRTQMLPGQLTLFDLRPLRTRLRDVDPLTRRMILAFDFYLAVRDPRPATPITRR